MFALKQFFVRVPSRFVQLAFLGPRKKIAALQRECATLPAFDSSPHRVLPVRRMEHHFPGVVPAGSRAPCGLLRGHSPDGLLEVRSMPGLFLVGVSDQRENKLCRINDGLLAATSSS